MKCSNIKCGSTDIPEGSKYCPDCGKPLNFNYDREQNDLSEIFEDIYTKVKKILSDTFFVDKKKITIDANIFSDLGLSLDAAQRFLDMLCGVYKLNSRDVEIINAPRICDIISEIERKLFIKWMIDTNHKEVLENGKNRNRFRNII